MIVYDSEAERPSLINVGMQFPRGRAPRGGNEEGVDGVDRATDAYQLRTVGL
jgi:hypothetical protein